MSPPVLALVRQTNQRLTRSWFRSRPKLTVSQWADRYRFLSPEASFRAGKYQSDDAPYQKEFMDVCGDPRNPFVVGMWGSQLGKTETLNNVAGYYMDQDPAPILMLQPTLDMAESWSKDRLAPMLRDTPRLKGKVSEARSRDSGNTILHKSFVGGHLTIVGSTSAAGLASRPIRVLLRDEIDRYTASAGSEGDPRAISESRTSTFPNKKIIDISSPTIKEGPIGIAYEASDQREFFVPCPHCNHEQKLEFGGKDTTWGIKWDEKKSETAHYVCRACAAVIEESDKMLMLKRGRWIAQNPDATIPGFRISAVYSPFFRWSELVARFLRDKEDPLKLQGFINTILCEFWVEGGEQVDEGVLEAHKVPFPRGDDPDDPQPIVPHGVGVLVRSVDVQGDRLETWVWGFGHREEAWRTDFELLPGDPATKDPWDELDRVVKQPYRHESGAPMSVSITFIDAGGHHAQQAYDFARKHARQRVFAIKGSSLQEGVPIVSEPRRHKTQRVVTYQVGSYTGKQALMRRLLKVQRPELGERKPFYIWLPSDIDAARLEQFLNEKLMPKIVNGRPKGVWVRTGPNEEIDGYVYALGALHALGPKVIDSLEARAKELSEWKPAQAKATEEDPLAILKRRRKGNWVDEWKHK